MSGKDEESGGGQGQSDGRKAERTAIERTCEIRIGQRNWHMARLLDLTPEGFRLAITGMPRVGTSLKIRMPGMAMLEAEICWARDFEVGCRFASPLSPYVFEHLVRQ